MKTAWTVAALILAWLSGAAGAVAVITWPFVRRRYRDHDD